MEGFPSDAKRSLTVHSHGTKPNEEGYYNMQFTENASGSLFDAAKMVGSVFGFGKGHVVVNVQIWGADETLAQSLMTHFQMNGGITYNDIYTKVEIALVRLGKRARVAMAREEVSNILTFSFDLR